MCFGNLNQQNTIVVRYHGILTENCDLNSTQFNMFYFFDGRENDKKVIKLNKCTKCAGSCFCASIDLDMHYSFHFGFFNQNEEFELGKDNVFKLEITPDPIANIMQRYGFEQNTNLPLCEENNPKIYIFQNILNIIKNFVYSLFKKNTSA